MPVHPEGCSPIRGFDPMPIDSLTEGQITKLKLVKRQMYGRGKLDLLQARVIGPE